jgi:hypothetical protein
MPRHTRTRTIDALASRALGVALVGASAMTLSSQARADLSYLLAPAPGGFVQACAGPATSGIGWAGNDYFPSFGVQPGADLSEEAFVDQGEAEQQAAYQGAFQGGTISNSCHGIATLGSFRGSASSTSPDAAFFPTGVANGGWSETFLIDHPSLTGQAGFMQFTLDVAGTLYAEGLTGSASFTVTAYKDQTQLVTNPLFDPGGSDVLSTNAQYGNWGIATYGIPPTDGKTVDDTVVFAVPFTFGTPFKLGVYANVRAGLRSSGGVGGSSSALADFEEGLTWGGISAVYVGRTPTSGYTIISGSGLDWSGPIGGGPAADLNGDGSVNATDLAILLGGWGTADGDVNGDGTTDASDLAELLGAWSA